MKLRGEFWSARSTQTWGMALPEPRRRPPGPVIVASFVDARKLTGTAELIYVEHGAGQSYDGDPRGLGHGSYSGGSGLDAVRLFVCPRVDVADRWRTVYPGVPAVAVGSPKLDDRHRSPTKTTNIRNGPTVAVSFHWENPLVPESRSALAHYERHLSGLIRDVRAAGGELIGHGHPRAWGVLWRLWRRLGVEPVPNLDDVFDRASVFVADNTSALYEFASLDRPVVVLNAPWYRRDVAHGLRFWETIPGIQVNDGADLVDGVAEAATDPSYLSAVRHDAVRRTYASVDGHASERAVDAIQEIFDR